MALENILSEEIIQKLGWTLLHFVWQAAAAALLLGILLALLRKSSANVRYIVACAVLILIVLLPIVTFQLVPVSTRQPGAKIEPGPAPAALPVEPVEESPLDRALEYMEMGRAENVDTAPTANWKQHASELLDSSLPYIVDGWLLGVFGLSLWHLGGWAQLQRLKEQMVKPVEASLQVKLNELSGRLKVKRAVRLLESALIQVPTVVGWLRPVILLPASALTGLTAEQLEALLAHELAHIRRYDYLVNMLQTVVETLGFYHPAVWWVSHRIRIERENCCDDLAVSLSGDRVCYARALASMEEIRSGRRELAVAATGGSLFSRIRRLIGKESSDRCRAGWIPFVITILLIAIISVPTTIALTAKSPESRQETDAKGNVKPESAEWENTDEIIPADFNDTKVLTEHINMGSIGRDCEGKVFITCILDSAQSSVRRHRFVLVQKNGNILEPSGYTRFGPENKLHEKFSFNAPFRRREIEGFRFQIKPSLLTGIDDSLLQLQRVNSAAVEQGKPVLSELAPPGRYAIELDGIDDYLLVPDSPSLRLEAPFTVEMWIKTNLPTDPNKEYWGWAILSKGFHVGTPRAWLTGFGVVLRRYSQDPSQLHAWYSTANNSGAFTMPYGIASELKNGKSGWMHISHVFNGENYKSAPGQPLVIGKFLIPTTRPLMGQIGEIRIWNGARTREQIRRYENAALTGNEHDLAAWWPFEQKEGQFAYDMSGNNNHARLGSSPGPDDADPKWIDLEAAPDQADRSTNASVESKSSGEIRQGLMLAIVPNIGSSGHEPSLTKEEYQQYLNSLAQNGPLKESIPGSSFQWFPVKSDLARFKQLPLSIYKNQNYILLCTQAKYVMVPRIEGRQVWGIENALISQDAGGRPAIQIRFDEKGAELFYKLTKANIGNYCAICVDGQILSAPLIETAIRKFAMITGNFDQQELLRLVENLQKGMVITTDTRNNAQQEQLNEILAKFSNGTTAEKSDSNFKSVRESVENYIAAALAGEDEKAAEYAYPGTAVAAQTKDVREILQGQNIKIVAACIGEWNSLVISSVIQADQGRKGSVVFHLKKVILDQKVHWLIDDIDLETIETIEQAIKRFIEKNPDARMIIMHPYTPSNKQSDASVESDSSGGSRQKQTPVPSVPKSAKSIAPAGTDKPIVKVDLAVIKVPPGSQVDKETIAEIRSRLGGKIVIPNPSTVEGLLRNASEGITAVKDKSAGDRQDTQQQFKTLLDLLVSRGFVKILMNPSMEVVELQTAQIKTDRNLLEVTANGIKDDIIYLTVQAELTSQIGPPNEGKKPVISRRSFASFVRISSGQSQIIGGVIRPAAHTSTEGNAKVPQTPAGELMYIVTASIVAPAADRVQQKKQITISGQCRDSGGRPLTNAQVLLFCRDSGLGSLIQIAKDETDSDGRFILGPITRPDEEDRGRRSYFIFVPADGHGPAWKTVNLYGPTNEPLELTAYKPAIVTGNILIEDSKPVARAKVWVQAIISPEATEDPASRVNDLYTNAALPGWSATTEQGGSFRIAGVPDGAIIQLFISHRDFAGIIVNVKPGAEAKIKMQPAATIAGRVLYGKTGKPAAGVIVQAQAVEHIRIPGGYSMSWAQTITDEQGRYKLESLYENKYNIWAEAENLTVVALDSFQAVAGETIEAPDLVLIEGGFITGRVIDEATGKPIRPGQHSDVGIYGPSRPKSGAAIESSDIKEDGSFIIRVAPGRNYIYLRAMGEWGGDKAIASPAGRWVNVSGGQTVEVEFKVRKLTQKELEVQAKRRQKETIKYILPKTIDEVEQNGKETKEPPADDRTAKEMIEHIIDVNLPESARNCKYHSMSLELGVVFCYGYFEIHRTDLLSLMDTSEKLPDASELGQNPFAIRQVEKALELSSEGTEWWKPLSLDNRQYANKVIFSSPSALGGYVGLAICTGEIRDDFMSVYLVYQAD